MCIKPEGTSLIKLYVMFRPTIRIVVFLFLFLPCARAKVVVKDTQFGFSYELPVGFKEADKNVPGHNAADVVQSHAGPAFRGQPAVAVIVERLHAPLAQPSGAAAREGTVEWKAFRLPIERKEGGENGEAMLTFQVRVPLAPEAMRITASGPAAQEKRVRNALETVLSSLEGPTDWKPEATPAAAPKPADVKPQTAQTAKPKPPVPTAQPNNFTQVAKPETPPRDWAFWTAIIAGGLFVPLMLYVRFRQIISLSKTARYGVLAALFLGMMAVPLTGPAPFSSTGSLSFIAFCAVGIVFAFWRIKKISKESGADEAPTTVEPHNRLLAELANKSDLQIRMLGLLLVAVAGTIVEMNILAPLHQAETEHPSYVSYSGKPIILLPLFAVVSSMMVILGKDLVRMTQRMAEQRRATGKKISIGGLIFFIALFVAGFVLMGWFHAKLRALGYKA